MTEQEKAALKEATGFYYEVYKQFYGKCKNVELALRMAQGYNMSVVAGAKMGDSMKNANTQEISKYLS